MIAGDLAEVGRGRLQPGRPRRTSGRELDLARDTADRRGRRAARSSAAPTSAAATCSARSTRSREGEGFGTALLDWAEQRASERGATHVRQGVGDRGDGRPRAPRGPRLRRSRSFWRMDRDDRHRARAADETGLRAVDAADAPALHAITDRAFARDAGYEHEAAGGVDAPRVQRPRRRPRALARDRDDRQRLRARPPLGRATRSTSRCSPCTPTHQGQGLGGAPAAAPCSPPPDGRPASIRLNVASDNPNAVKLYERVGMRQALARRRLPEGAARLGRPMGSIPINIADHVGRTPMVQFARLAPEGGGDGLRQARDVQPRRLGQGPDRRGDDRGGGAGRAGSSPAARPSSRPPAATPASRWRSCARPRATS